MGFFWGAIKGPAVFWEKDQETIGAKSYQERIMPVVGKYLLEVNGWKGQGRELLFMQDMVPGRAAKATKDLIESLGILRFEWPPYSPGLNPIETMKLYLQDKYEPLIPCFLNLCP